MQALAGTEGAMAKLKCPKCFYVNPDGRDTCAQCNAPLPRIRIEAPPVRAPSPPSAPEIQFRQGETVAQRYTVLKLIGRGGMGAIYKVHDNILGEEVALKTLLPQFARDKLVVERFFNEARIARRLAHPNIVRVHDIGSTGKVIYISMEFVAGKSLRNAMEQLRQGARMPVLQTLLVMDELCAALEYAHQYTIHRDIKPENVMIDQTGRVKLMDFGISKLMADTRLTGASVVMGTPFYMAPEQLRNSRDVDARADIYSMGVMLYEILTGNVPTGVPKPLSEILTGVPKELDEVVRRCVEPDPKDRFQSVTELRAAIARVREPLGADVKVSRWRPHVTTQTVPVYRARKIAGIVLTAAILAGSAFGLYRAEQHRRHVMQTPKTAHVSSPAGAVIPGAAEALIERVRPGAEQRASAPGSRVRAAFDAGEEMLARAHEAAGANDPDADLFAGFALQSFVATLIWPEGMAFVPAGRAAIGGESVWVAPFFIDEAEVTAGQFAQFCREVEGGWPNPLPPDYPEDFPVTLVSYYDARAYAAWKGLTRRQGKLLPTEAQWQRAACGEGNAPYPWGDKWSARAAKTKGSGEDAMPAPVKSHGTDQSEFGCYDMAGNVSEWTRSFFDVEEEARFDGQPDFGAHLVVRGGNFNTAEVTMHDRFYEVFEQRRMDLGFRCVLQIPRDPGFIDSLAAG